MQLLETYDLDNGVLNMQAIEKKELLFAALSELEAYAKANEETLFNLDNIELYAQRLNEHSLYDTCEDITSATQQIYKNSDNDSSKLNNVNVLLHELLKNEYNTVAEYSEAVGAKEFRQWLKSQHKH